MSPLNSCGRVSVLMYPILFSVTDGRCSDSVRKTGKKSTWASSLIRGNVNAQSDHRLDLPSARNRPCAHRHSHPAGAGPAGLSSHGFRSCGPCPLGGLRFASSRMFSVSLVHNRYCCLTRQAAGTQPGLSATVHGLGVHAAVEDLCRRLGLPALLLPSEWNPRTTV